jgi:hypothetical protein
MAVFFAFCSGASVVTGVHTQEQRRAVWVWAASFAEASLVAAYCFWRLRLAISRRRIVSQPVMTALNLAHPQQTRLPYH